MSQRIYPLGGSSFDLNEVTSVGPVEEHRGSGNEFLSYDIVVNVSIKGLTAPVTCLVGYGRGTDLAEIRLEHNRCNLLRSAFVNAWADQS